MLWRNSVEGPVNRTLKLRPEAFNGVGVNLATNVFALPVADRFVEVPKCLNLVVTVGFVGSDDRARLDHSLQERHERNLLAVGNGLGFHSSLALDHAEHGSFARCAPSTLSASTDATDVGFIGFHHIITAQRIGVLAHKLADLLCDTPSALIGNSEVPLQFFSGNTVLTLAHEKDGVKPKRERRSALVEDRSFGGVGLVSAGTSVRTAILNGVAHVSSAFRALQAIGISLFENMGEAGSVTGEIIMEILNRVLHSYRIPKCLLVVKG